MRPRELLSTLQPTGWAGDSERLAESWGGASRRVPAFFLPTLQPPSLDKEISEKCP